MAIASPIRDLELVALDKLRSIDVRPENAWKDFIAIALRAGLSVQEMAEALPCAPSTVSRWSTGKSVPPQFSRGPMKELIVGLVKKRLGE